MASCTYTVPSPSQMDTSGDNWYANRMNQWQAFFDWAWDAYDFDEGDWDDGFGFEDRWNRTKPLARTMAGLYCLVYSPGSGNWDPNGNLLQMGWRYSSDKIDEVDGRCGDGSAFATTQTGGLFVDEWTRLFMPFFYDQGVVLRAGTILHESRHAGGKGHNAGKNDTTWEYNGAWRWHVVWLWWFYVAAVGTTSAFKLQAKQKANSILASRFTTDPGFRIT
jgi:hypothetical protein